MINENFHNERSPANSEEEPIIDNNYAGQGASASWALSALALFAVHSANHIWRINYAPASPVCVAPRTESRHTRVGVHPHILVTSSQSQHG